MHCIIAYLNQISHYTRCNTAKSVKGWLGPLRLGSTAPLEEILQQWRAVGNTAANLTDLKFEPQTSRSRVERVTSRPTGGLLKRLIAMKQSNMKNKSFPVYFYCKHIELPY